ncbi:MAG: hypothetical protein HDT27_03680 [Subdoligranulum sp.]|nr:hypothetical protein [Subdoligranulum sp.]
MDGIYRICKFAMGCIVHGDYALLEDCNAFTRVSEDDIRRVLKEYASDESPVMPPDAAFEETAYIVAYRDGSGYHIDINFWYPSGESDLTLQLDVRKRQGRLSFIVDDIHVL